MATIKIKGRNVPLLYTVYEMKAIQEEIGPLAEAINLVLGRNPEDEKDRSKYLSREHLEAATKLIRILGNAGLEEAGEAPNLTDKMIARAIRPVELPIMISACMDAMNAGMMSEIPEKKQDVPVDVVLEEIEKKKEADG